MDSFQHEELLYEMKRIRKLLKKIHKQQKTTDQTVIDQGETVMADLSALQAEVSENSDVVASAVSLLSSLSTELRNAATDPAAVQALADQLDANTQSLAAAVAENTPAAPSA